MSKQSRFKSILAMANDVYFIFVVVLVNDVNDDDKGVDDDDNET